MNIRNLKMWGRRLTEGMLVYMTPKRFRKKPSNIRTISSETFLLTGTRSKSHSWFSEGEKQSVPMWLEIYCGLSQTPEGHQFDDPFNFPTHFETRLLSTFLLTEDEPGSFSITAFSWRRKWLMVDVKSTVDVQNLQRRISWACSCSSEDLFCEFTVKILNIVAPWRMIWLVICSPDWRLQTRLWGAFMVSRAGSSHVWMNHVGRLWQHRFLHTLSVWGRSGSPQRESREAFIPLEAVVVEAQACPPGGVYLWKLRPLTWQIADFLGVIMCRRKAGSSWWTGSTPATEMMQSWRDNWQQQVVFEGNTLCKFIRGLRCHSRTLCLELSFFSLPPLTLHRPDTQK